MVLLVYAVVDSFNAIGGQTRNRIAALDASTGAATAWNPNANSTVYKIALNGSSVFMQEAIFLSIGGQTRLFIAELNAITGASTAWNPSSNATVTSIAINGTTVYAGGSLLLLAGKPGTVLPHWTGQRALPPPGILYP